MREIELTQGQVTVVDDEDYEWLNQWKWHATKGARGGFYAVRNSARGGSRGTSTGTGIGKRHTVWMHRLILHTPKNMESDHKDGDSLNNRKYNLRICTHGQNVFNSNGRKNSSSIYKGVVWDASRSKWKAAIGFNSKLKYLGRYDDEIDAAKVYDKAAVKYFGEFARVNTYGEHR